MSAVDDHLAAARADLTRIDPLAANALHERGEAVFIDIRPVVNRLEEGEIPGSIPVERIHLEWRLDPAGDHRIPGFDADSTVIVLCNEGYASSFAARDIKALGLPHATDLIGGFRAWHAAGLPVRDGGTPAVP
ncbi:rhodanese-like domain-containing protein [Actinokineospora globicatena]|uniref:rhodanese-like domain-containing protein n=1 Tax=Actinokineospora globicatena TaxID=103729 RepID=UPI0020A5EC93|nr:rhodanese-like domain-containing protein [Actinokineospora globicatena]MCP2305445.1 Rhodanese-related sulfurtransferase [Actinokineospora globicatena]GLW81313.1 sulfurtransferase [Actinokineospora globicatena]GLW87989.1 sulfurtransferase [Actinokineospora globicatena]